MKKIKASVTVESSLLLPVILGIIIILIQFNIYYMNKCIENENGLYLKLNKNDGTCIKFEDVVLYKSGDN